VLVVLWSRRLHAAVSDVGRESSGARTLSGSLRKAVAIGRPLHAVSTGIAKARVVQGSGTYFLSFAVFRPFRNCRPLAVVVSTVSALALDSPCTHAVHCQRTRPLSGGRALSPSAPSAGGVMLRAPWRGRRAVKGLLVNPVVALQEPARLPHRIATNIHLRLAEPPPTMPQHYGVLHVPALSGASQGARRRRPSLRWQPCAWLRFPFSPLSWSRRLSKPMPNVGKAGTASGAGVQWVAVNCGYLRAPSARTARSFPKRPRPVRVQVLATLRCHDCCQTQKKLDLSYTRGIGFFCNTFGDRSPTMLSFHRFCFV
jgi:hypothetical protein